MEPAADFSNIKCWRNAAVGSVGFITNNPKFISYAMADTTSLVPQIKKDFNSEGFSVDLSPNYQFYALVPLTLLAQAAQNNGYPVYLLPLKKMFETPLAMANSRLLLPAFNDSKPIYLGSERYLYEWAFAQFGNPAFVEVLSNPDRGSFKNIGPIFTGWGLLYGKDSLPKASLRSTASRNFIGTGVAVLSKSEKKENLTAYLKYADQNRPCGHCQSAQLEFAMIKGGEHISIIPGNVNYASPLSFGWYKSSISHNTIVRNQKDQQKSAAGKILAFGKEGGVDYAITESTTAYDHIRFVRTLAVLNENLLLVVDEFRSTQKNTDPLFDIAYHQAGKWMDSTMSEPWQAPNIKGYKYLTHTSVNKDRHSFALYTILASGRKVTISGAANKPMDIITGYGKAFMGKDVPTSIFRIKNNDAILAYCISTDGQIMKVGFGPAIDKGSDSTIFSYSVQVRLENEKGIRTNVWINPDKEQILGKKNLTDKYFFVEHL